MIRNEVNITKDRVIITKEISITRLLQERADLWYKENYKKDDLGEKINNVTFADLLKSLEVGKDIYDCIGVGDSVIRERLFEELARRLNVDYDRVYELWLNKGVQL